MPPMSGRRTFIAWARVGALLLAACGVHAQTAYKCGSASYSDRVCNGGRVVGPAGAKATERSKPVPQDRAKIARRATLSEEDRAECKALDGRKAEQEAALKKKEGEVSLQDEMPLVHTKKRMRELRC